MYTIKVKESFSGKSEIFYPQTKEEFETFANVYKFSFPDQEYRVNGVLHRENGPAKIWHDEEGIPISSFYTYGKLVRTVWTGRCGLHEAIYEDDNKRTVKFNEYKNINGIDIWGEIIRVFIDDKLISENFEPLQTWKDVATERLTNLRHTIEDLQTKKDNIEEQLVKMKKEQTELTNKLNTLQ
jgi:hypothetical protein